MCTHFNLTYLRHSTTNKYTRVLNHTHTSPQAFTHTQTCTKSKIYIPDSKFCSSLFSNRCLNYELQLDMKNATTSYKLRKPITDSECLSKNFTHTLYACAHLKIFIIYYQFLTFHSFMCNPTCEKWNIATSSGINLHVPVFIYSYLVKMFQKPVLIYSRMHNTTQSCSSI